MDTQKLPVRQSDTTDAVFSPMDKSHTLHFSDIGGLDDLKQLARIKIIEPFKRPELFKKFNKAAGGGLLLYGPPGCGKTMFARAIAGECKAAFFNVGIHDILDMYVGNSEKNIAALFTTARAAKPAVIFIDEIDALGRKRGLMRHSGLTSTINAFLAELDGAQSDNENLLVLGATNAPWDVDSAFRRPGRFDRCLFVPPPDQPARQVILQLLLQQLPTATLDITKLAESSADYSGADLKGLVDSVSEQVLQHIIESGEDALIEQQMLETHLALHKASTLEWLQTASQVVEFAGDTGYYQDLAQYLASRQKPKWRIGF
ncbi:ATP-binding protein [Rheinheimera mangrovi]|uniref:ATP-binding protein n=1 Tax=Rheinheimera mangrovi TaxID=2498451 RepID=UPI000F8C8E17|nr:ATP-binding protein [Rheinheimera mangrovi]